MRRPSAAVLLLTGLVAVDMVLVTGAVRSTHVDTARIARSMEKQASSTGSPTGSSTASAATTPAASTNTSGKVVVAAVSAERAWRASSTSVVCTPGSDAVHLEHSDDGGAHWTATKLPMNTVSGLSYAGNALVATGTDRSCEPTAYALSSRRAPRSTTAEPTWTIDPENPTKLRKSGDPVAEQPCRSAILDVATNSSTDLAVLCGDHSVQHSTDAGRSWQKAGDGSDVLAIATGHNVIYVVTEAKCGIAVAPATADHPTKCVAGTKDWSGPLDATIVVGTLWLATADDAVTEPVAQLS
ncbi:hypothetical protein [Flexivirga sp. B27]